MERVALHQARVVNGVVEIMLDGEYLPPSDDVIIQAIGGADSNGFVFIGEAIALYFVNTQPDLQIIIDKIVESIDETINIANQLVVKVPSSPAVILDAAAAAALEIIKTELEDLKLR